MQIKKSILALGIIIAIVALAFSPKNITEYNVDKNKSKVAWVGKKVTGEHSGFIQIADGKLLAEGGTFTGGSFSIDMNSITCTDLKDAGYNGKLVGHLKSEDFFGVEKHKTSNLVITKITSTGKDQYNVKGNLTIKGITKEIEFPATITVNANDVTAKAKIVVDRTLYDIKYGSGSFFDNLGDKAIDNNFELNVDLVAKK
ncbi:MAG: YceI family protein [Cytophagaceae bacterium]